jgi:PAS domain S-box-containing protein
MEIHPKARILAVDDTPGNLVALEAVLGDKYDLVKARSGAEAIELLQRDSGVDVILLDILMPGMDGYETAKRIKALPGCQEIPLVFLSAVYNEDPHIKRGYALGAVDYFTKPFDPDILRLKIDVYAAFRQRAALLKLKERQLRESQDLVQAGRRLASVLEGVSFAVIIADSAGRACRASEDVLRILEWPREKTVGYGDVLEWWERNGQPRKDGRSTIARCLESGESSPSEVVRLECLDGTTKRVLQSVTPLRGLNGAIVGAVVVLLDVTESKRSGADFEDRIARLVSLGMEFEDTVGARRQQLD